MSTSSDHPTPLDPPALWDEDQLLNLSPYEYDFQEFKASNWLVDANQSIQSDFLYALSKQVSAFSNGVGGLIFIGINDQGHIDGGVPIDLKGGGTREWLEDILTHSVYPPLASFNVYEVSSSPADQAFFDQSASEIRPNHAVYVLDIPSSLQAPHQAKDRRYYLRIAGKSRPMNHMHIEDLLRRNTLPRIQLSKLHPYGEIEYSHEDTRGPEAFICVRACIHNVGRSMAKHVGLELSVPQAFSGRAVRKRMEALDETHYTHKNDQATFFHYHTAPLFPTQEVYAFCLWIYLHTNNLPLIHQEAEIQWAIYADDSHPLKGTIPLHSFSHVRQACEWIEEISESPS